MRIVKRNTKENEIHVHIHFQSIFCLRYELRSCANPNWTDFIIHFRLARHYYYQQSR